MESRKAKQVLSGGWHQWEREDIGKEWRKVKYYILMFENGKMRPVEIVLGMGGGGIMKNDGGGKFNYDIL
jgi:hypothetical protein